MSALISRKNQLKSRQWIQAIAFNPLLLDKTPDNTKRIVQTALSLLQNQAIGAANQHRDRLAGVFDPGDLDNLGTGKADFVHRLGVSELLLGEGINVGDGLAAKGLNEQSRRDVRIKNKETASKRISNQPCK